MAVEDDPLLPEDDLTEEDDALEQDESVDQIDGDEGEGDADDESQDPAGATDDQRAAAEEHGQVRQPSRAERRIQQALREAKEAKERTAALEQQLAQRTAQPVESPSARAERLAMMDPDERHNYELNELKQSVTGELAQIRFQTAESADRTAYEALCARSPVASRFRDQVEDYLTNARKTGWNAPRETVLKYLIGERALANAGRANGKAARKAGENIQRQAARPGNARGDQSPGRSTLSEQAARAKRLEDQQI